MASISINPIHYDNGATFLGERPAHVIIADGEFVGWIRETETPWALWSKPAPAWHCYGPNGQWLGDVVGDEMLAAQHMIEAAREEALSLLVVPNKESTE